MFMSFQGKAICYFKPEYDILYVSLLYKWFNVHECYPKKFASLFKFQCLSFCMYCTCPCFCFQMMNLFSCWNGINFLHFHDNSRGFSSRQISYYMNEFLPCCKSCISDPPTLFVIIWCCNSSPVVTFLVFWSSSPQQEACRKPSDVQFFFSRRWGSPIKWYKKKAINCYCSSYLHVKRSQVYDYLQRKRILFSFCKVIVNLMIMLSSQIYSKIFILVLLSGV